jgi:uncharacterized membrane protein YphA (DoxX/SURF4 family)
MSDGFAKHTLAPLILRLALAAVFIYHGLDKVLGYHNDWGAAWATNLLAEQGKIPREVREKLDTLAKDRERSEEDRGQAATVRTRLEHLYARTSESATEALQYHAAQLAVAWGELLGGIALLLGFLSRLAAAGLIVIQAGAILTVTWVRGFAVTEGGYEYNLVLIAACLVLICLGSGPFSLAGLLRRRRRGARPPSPAQQPVNV